VEQSESAPASMKAAALRQSDHFFCQRPDSSRLGESCFDPPVLNQTARLIGKQSVSVLGCAA
jgi:hypothetical protein